MDTGAWDPEASDRDPAERNFLMAAVHVVWGATLAASLSELERAAKEIFAGGSAVDAHSNISGRKYP